MLAAAGALALVIVVATGFGSGNREARLASGTISVGFGNNLTGFLAVHDHLISQGAQLAVQQINAKGGIGGKVKIKLKLKDVKSDPATAVEVANATGQRCQQLVSHRRHVVEHRHEVSLAEEQKCAVGFAQHGCSARPVVEQGKLAHDGARPQRRDLLTVALHHHGTIENDERFSAGLSLIHDQRAGGHDDFVACLGNLFEVLLRTRREQ
jgi:hypothetical protein